MPNYRRPKATGATIFFTVCLADRTSDLLVREVGLLRRAVAKTMRDWPFQVRAWVVLPDHLHCVWTMPGGDGDFSARWRLIKARFSRELPAGRRRSSHGRRRERGIWQRRFWEHHVRTDEDLAACVHYCWYNPVKHGLVEEPHDWPYSSIHRDIPRQIAVA